MVPSLGGRGVPEVHLPQCVFVSPRSPGKVDRLADEQILNVHRQLRPPALA